MARGLTLIEILVAMTLVLVVVAGSTALLARGRSAHRTSEAVAQIEESLDAAFGLLVDDIRLAGYLGLAPPATAVRGASALGNPERADLVVSGSCGPSLAHDVAAPLVAVDSAYGAAPGVTLACRASPNGRAMPLSDTLVVRHASAESTSPQSGRLQLETNLRAAALAANGAATLGTGARWHDVEVSVFYISRDSTGRRDWPSLRRKRLVGGTRPAFQDEELVSGIDDLQVLVGLDDTGDMDDSVDHWIQPGAAAGGGAPRALRLELDARSDIPELGQPGMSRRKRVSRVIELRNSVGTP